MNLVTSQMIRGYERKEATNISNDFAWMLREINIVAGNEKKLSRENILDFLSLIACFMIDKIPIKQSEPLFQSASTLSNNSGVHNKTK